MLYSPNCGETQKACWTQRTYETTTTTTNDSTICRIVSSGSCFVLLVDVFIRTLLFLLCSASHFGINFITLTHSTGAKSHCLASFVFHRSFLFKSRWNNIRKCKHFFTHLSLYCRMIVRHQRFYSFVLSRPLSLSLPLPPPLSHSISHSPTFIPFFSLNKNRACLDALSACIHLTSGLFTLALLSIVFIRLASPTKYAKYTHLPLSTFSVWTAFYSNVCNL